MATQHWGHHFTLPYMSDFLRQICLRKNEIQIPTIRDILMWGVSSDPDAVSVKLGESQTGSQTPEFSRGKKTKYKVFRRKGNSFSIKLEFERRSPPVAEARLENLSNPQKSIFHPTFLQRLRTRNRIKVANLSLCV